MQFSQTIQFSISMPLVLFNPEIGPYQVLPLRDRMDLGAIAVKGYSAFPKTPALLEPHHQTVYCHIQDIHWVGWGFLPLCRGAVNVFYSPSRLSKKRVFGVSPIGQYRMLNDVFMTDIALIFACE